MIEVEEVKLKVPVINRVGERFVFKRDDGARTQVIVITDNNNNKYRLLREYVWSIIEDIPPCETLEELSKEVLVYSIRKDLTIEEYKEEIEIDR